MSNDSYTQVGSSNRSGSWFAIRSDRVSWKSVDVVRMPSQLTLVIRTGRIAIRHSPRVRELTYPYALSLVQDTWSQGSPNTLIEPIAVLFLSEALDAFVDNGKPRLSC